MRNIDKIVIHHSASGAKTTVDDIRRWHIKRGWNDIGYHAVVEGNGDISPGRPEILQGAHAYGANEDSLGVCVVGNFDTVECRKAQFASLIVVITIWCEKYKIKVDDIFSHENVPGGKTSTVCPGKYLARRLSEIRQAVYSQIATPRKQDSGFESCYNDMSGDAKLHIRVCGMSEEQHKVMMKYFWESGFLAGKGMDIKR